MATTSLDNKIVTLQQGKLYLIQSPSSSYTSSGALTCAGNSNAIFTNAPYTGQLNYQWLIQPVSSPSALNSSQTYYLINQSNSLGLQLCPSSEVCPGPPPSNSTPQPNTTCVDASIVSPPGVPPQTSLWTIINASSNSIAIRNAYTGLYLSPCGNCLNGPSSVLSQPVVNSRTANPTTLLVYTIVGSAPPPPSPTSLMPSFLPIFSPSPSPSPSPYPSSGLSSGAIAGIVIGVVVVVVVIIFLIIWFVVRKKNEEQSGEVSE